MLPLRLVSCLVGVMVVAIANSSESPGVLSFRGYGLIHFGMALKDVTKIVGAPAAASQAEIRRANTPNSLDIRV
jgi:hypothetical protein